MTIKEEDLWQSLQTLAAGTARALWWLGNKPLDQVRLEAAGTVACPLHQHKFWGLMLPLTLQVFRLSSR